MSAERSLRGPEPGNVICLFLVCYLRVFGGGEAGDEPGDEPGCSLGVSRYAEVPPAHRHVSQRSWKEQDRFVEVGHVQLGDRDAELPDVCAVLFEVCVSACRGGAGGDIRAHDYGNAVFHGGVWVSARS